MVIAIFQIAMQLMGEAHGTPYAGRDCAACKMIGEQLSEWLNAHSALVRPE